MGTLLSEAPRSTMTSVEYVKEQGMACPACGGRDVTIEGGESFYFGRSATTHCCCENCGATWEDCYELVGYDNLVLRGPVEKETSQVD